jgi:hypothetical protein
MNASNGKHLTNRQLAERDELFRKACELAGVFPSKKRYIRWKHKHGRPYQLAQQLLIDKTPDARIAEK